MGSVFLFFCFFPSHANENRGTEFPFLSSASRSPILLPVCDLNRLEKKSFFFYRNERKIKKREKPVFFLQVENIFFIFRFFYFFSSVFFYYKSNVFFFFFFFLQGQPLFRGLLSARNSAAEGRRPLSVPAPAPASSKTRTCPQIISGCEKKKKSFFFFFF